MARTTFKPVPIKPKEVERLRLLLSTYQDGSGYNGGGDEPGWRDFERVAAATFSGTAAESKAIFDVLIPHPTIPNAQYGISCKMREMLDHTLRTQRVVVEVSNASSKFEAAIKDHGFDQKFLNYPTQIGKLVVDLIEQWNAEVSISRGGTVDLTKSSYLVLSYTKKTKKNPMRSYQLHQFPPSLPNPSSLIWTWPQGKTGHNRLVGVDTNGATIFEWYRSAGGQLKYYPHVNQASWHSAVFQLEPLPAGDFGIAKKAESYFPALWAKCRP